MKAIDLSPSSGLPLTLHPDMPAEGPLHTSASDFVLSAPDVRRAEEMQSLWRTRPSGRVPDVLYWMYRGVALSRDIARIRRLGLRFDLTVLRPGKIEGEWIKTAGHYHPRVPGQDLTYPELYGVVSGKAAFLLQHAVPDAERLPIDEVFLLLAETGQVVYIPPDCGHITINCGGDPLVLANWVAADFSSLYAPMREAGGGALFLVDDAVEIHPNPSLPSMRMPEFRIVEPVPEWGLDFGLPLYHFLELRPRLLRFLTHPQEGRDLWAILFQRMRSFGLRP